MVAELKIDFLETLILVNGDELTAVRDDEADDGLSQEGYQRVLESPLAKILQKADGIINTK